MATKFTQRLFARWGDIDFNGHMRNTAYLDASADVRMLYFESRGFSMREFERLRFGPVVKRDELEYFRETRLLEPIDASLLLGGLSADGSRFRMVNEFHRTSGELVARVTSSGGWLDLAQRKLAAPPAELAAVLAALARHDSYAEIVQR